MAGDIASGSDVTEAVFPAVARSPAASLANLSRVLNDGGRRSSALSCLSFFSWAALAAALAAAFFFSRSAFTEALLLAVALSSAACLSDLSCVLGDGGGRGSRRPSPPEGPSPLLPVNQCAISARL